MRWPWQPRRSLRTLRLALELDNPDRCTLDGITVRLRPAEFALLVALAASPGRAVTWSRLYAAIWSTECFVEPGQVYSQASRLRRALSLAAPGEHLIETVPKHGLRLALAPAQVRLQAPA